MSNMFLHIWWYMWYVFVLVKTDSDYYINGKSFRVWMEQQLKTICASQNLVLKSFKVSCILQMYIHDCYINRKGM